MKQVLFFITLLALTATLSAQPGDSKSPKGQKPREEAKIETLVPDLTAAQKTRINLITRQTSKNIERLRKELDNVRDSIRSYMGSPTDHSAILFPLYDREGRLQAAISKEFYRSKVAVDQVLTPEQYKALNEKMKKQHPRHGKKETNKGNKEKH